MKAHRVASPREWATARRALLAKEKAFTAARDALSAERRALPWLRVEKPYLFHAADGDKTLADLFAGRSQLLVYHFMFAPDWAEGCKSCSFWADNFDGAVPHLAQRDVTLVAVSRAPLAKLEAFRRRMGWHFCWVSSADCDFNDDFGVSFTPAQRASGKPLYNFGTQAFNGPEAPGVSVFFKDEDGAVFNTYSCYARGLDMLNGTYQLLDLVPKGRDEAALAYPMAWVKLRDRYDAGAASSRKARTSRVKKPGSRARLPRG